MTDNQLQYIELCSDGVEPKEATRQVYKCKSEKVLSVAASRLKKNANIQREIENRIVNKTGKLPIQDRKLWIRAKLETIATNGSKESNKVRALELLAKEEGMLVDRQDITHREAMTDSQIQDFENVRKMYED